jgi:uncharacterized protein
LSEKNKISLALALTVILFAFASCNKSKKNLPAPHTSFDKQALLVNLADNLILPSYQNYKKSLDSLIVSYNRFRASGLLSDFRKVKQDFTETYLLYQGVDLFEFGPAEAVVFRMNCNIFPTDTTQINSNIRIGTYDLSSAANFDAKGFPALDYLLYGFQQEEQVLADQLKTSVHRQQYMSELLNNLSSKLNNVLTSWNSYRATFVNSLGTDVGSSLGFLVNQMSYQLDYLKNAKIGTPLGKKTFGTSLPEKCEGFYGGHSLQYALATLALIENTYLGKSALQNGIGFDDYLDHLHIKFGEQTLNAAIQSRFAEAKAKLSAIPDPLSTQVTSNIPAVEEAYAALVKLLVVIKTDMPSSLGVMITYQDGDGD